MDTQEELFALFTGLRDRDYAREGLLVCEGRIVVERALDAALEMRGLLCVGEEEALWRERSQTYARGPFPVLPLSRERLSALAGYPFHRGCLAVAARPRLESPRSVRAPSLVLWNVADMENLGALSRSARALGAASIGIGPGCADPFGRKSLRASMGQLLGLPLFKLDGLEDLDELKAAGVVPVAAALTEGACTPAELRSALSFSGEGGCGKLALFLGNEGWGLPPELVRRCSHVVRLPMAAGVDSLNVAAAGAILMWELFAQKR